MLGQAAWVATTVGELDDNIIIASRDYSLQVPTVGHNLHLTSAEQHNSTLIDEIPWDFELFLAVVTALHFAIAGQLFRPISSVNPPFFASLPGNRPSS